MATTDDRPGQTAGGERLVETFLTAFVGGDPDAVAALVTDDCVLHRPRWPLDTVGREAVVETTREMAGTFADVTVTVEETVVSGDRIAAFVTASGQNVGPMRVEDREIAPTGRTFEVPQFGIYRIEDGRVAEAWLLADALGIVEQLGNLPTGPGAMVGIALRQLRWRLGGRKRVEWAENGWSEPRWGPNGSEFEPDDSVVERRRQKWVGADSLASPSCGFHRDDGSAPAGSLAPFGRSRRPTEGRAVCGDR
ncbi:ester cyclase [Halorarius halobius]|uniref:ester cyclase n=1 Tax=Halorarius halobius TaxID=2962671 RepID=UPI0020CCC122|nr:ester cyclase [Halorarius halobius]